MRVGFAGGELVTGCRMMAWGAELEAGAGLVPGAGLGCNAGFLDRKLLDLGRHPAVAVVGDTGRRVICNVPQGVAGASRVGHGGDGGSSTFTEVPTPPNVGVYRPSQEDEESHDDEEKGEAGSAFTKRSDKFTLWFSSSEEDTEHDSTSIWLSYKCRGKELNPD